MPDLIRNTALSHRNQEDENQNLLIDIQERNDLGMIDLRGKPDDKAFMKNASAVLGVELPTKPRSSVTKGNVTILWLSIDHWLITSPLEIHAAILSDLDKKLKNYLHLACDVSDTRAVIRLTGDQVREVLIKGSSIDITSSEFVPGFVRRMLFAEVATLCHLMDDNPDVVDLYVFRSYANYVWEWLLQTAHEDTEVGLFQAQDIPAI